MYWISCLGLYFLRQFSLKSLLDVTHECIVDSLALTPHSIHLFGDLLFEFEINKFAFTRFRCSGN